MIVILATAYIHALVSGVIAVAVVEAGIVARELSVRAPVPVGTAGAFR